MTSRLDQLIENRYSLKLVMHLARLVPPRLGYALAVAIGSMVASRRSAPQVQAVRCNQWILSGCGATKAELDRAVANVFRNTALSIYDLYHYIQHPDQVSSLFVFEPSTAAILNRPEFDQRGLVVVGLHISSFDLAMQWIARQYLRPLVLTISNPKGAHRAELEFRQNGGLNIVPTGLVQLRQAIRYLQQGGLVVTGLDRPSPDYQPRPRFFGHPAALPTHYIYLALKAQVPVMYLVAQRRPDGLCHITASDPIEMQPHPDHHEALQINAERVLAVAEGYLRQTPQQWSIFLPVWPDFMNHVP